MYIHSLDLLELLVIREKWESMICYIRSFKATFQGDLNNLSLMATNTHLTCSKHFFCTEVSPHVTPHYPCYVAYC